MSLTGTLPHAVDGRHQGGSCPAAFISPLALLVPSYDPGRLQWDVLRGQMVPVMPRPKWSGSVHKQAWGFRLLLGLPEKIVRKTYPVLQNSWSGPNPQILQSLKLQRQSSLHRRLKKRVWHQDSRRMSTPTGRKNTKQ